jgi:UDP-N-acetylmuramate-alanine ligase
MKSCDTRIAGSLMHQILQSVHRNVGNMLEAGDLVLSLGAGNIHEQLEILAG